MNRVDLCYPFALIEFNFIAVKVNESLFLLEIFTWILRQGFQAKYLLYQHNKKFCEMNTCSFLLILIIPEILY